MKSAAKGIPQRHTQTAPNCEERHPNRPLVRRELLPKTAVPSVAVPQEELTTHKSKSDKCQIPPVLYNKVSSSPAPPPSPISSHYVASKENGTSQMVIAITNSAQVTGTTTTAGVGSQTTRTVNHVNTFSGHHPSPGLPSQPIQLDSTIISPFVRRVNQTGDTDAPAYVRKKPYAPHEELRWTTPSGKSTLPPDSIKSSPIANIWDCQRKIGSGSFGDAYLAINVNDGFKAAVKVESLKAKHPQLLHEAKILRQMQGQPGFPKLYYFGVHSDQYNVIVMELLGPTLEEAFSRWGGRRFSLATVALYGIQMVERLEALHRQGYIHRDVKPDNFLTGVGSQKNELYCIDFGLAKRYRDAKTHAHIPYNDRRSLTGTARYASINAHMGIEPTRRDDLTATGHALVYFATGGQLPWQGLVAKTKEEKYEKIKEKKMGTSLEELTAGLPDAFAKFLQHCRDLAFDGEPDYGYLRNLLKSIAADSSSSLWSSLRLVQQQPERKQLPECGAPVTANQRGDQRWAVHHQNGHRNHNRLHHPIIPTQDGAGNQSYYARSPLLQLNGEKKIDGIQEGLAPRVNEDGAVNSLVSNIRDADVGENDQRRDVSTASWKPKSEIWGF